MQELEKILEEIEIISIKDLEEENERCSTTCKEYCSDIKGTECYCRDAIIVRAFKKLAKYMNDEWIPVEDRLPEVDEDTEETIEDDYCPEYIVTIRGASESTVLKYSPNGTWFDDNGNAYDVIAWRPLPEPYKSKRSKK